MAVLLLLNLVAITFPLCVAVMVTLGGPSRVAGDVDKVLSLPDRLDLSGFTRTVEIASF